ncbi:hypothetical protein MPSEU_000263200 [Mayamaea pseudoterrestris]|nr:hypothetical protein MPSEU_000263200 [Mayamaea pseudoterrestris]
MHKTTLILLRFISSCLLLTRASAFVLLEPRKSPHRSSSPSLSAMPTSDPKHVEKILFVECGFGADAHGQDSTKAAVRACRNAIEFNQLPALGEIVPGGRDEMKLDVLLAVPAKYQEDLDLNAVRAVFPYGKVNIQIQDGGMVANHGKMIEKMGDKNEDMVVVCVAVSVGY